MSALRRVVEGEGLSKALEAEILKEALEHAAGSKKRLQLPPSPPKGGSR